MIPNAEWTTALRSGEYLQTNSRLRTSPYDYCCLGVRCDIAAKHGMGHWSSDELFEMEGYESETNSPDPLRLNSVTMAMLADVQDPDAEQRSFDKTGIDDDDALAWLNDGGLTFSQIADVIDHFQPYHIESEDY